MRTSRTPFRSIVVPCLLAACSVATAWAAPVTFHVSPAGSDGWTGRLATPNEAGTDGPFASLTRARDAVREAKAADGLLEGGIEVLVQSGDYFLDAPFELEAEDSGSEHAPVVYRAAEGAEVRLLGGRRVDNFTPVEDPATLEKLPENARGHVVRADLKALGIQDLGSPKGDGMELFFADEPMTLSRWPNEGFVRIRDIVEEDGHQIHGHKGSKTGKFVYEEDRPARWVDEADPWVHGYWFWDWSDERQAVKRIDPEKRIIEVEEPYHNYGYRKRQWYYAFNLLAELDRPGEWYADREAGVLYFWPTKPVGEAEAIVSVLPTLMVVDDASYVEIRGWSFEAARTTALRMTGGTRNAVVGCTFHNIGGNAVSVGGGARHRVAGCDIYNMGHGGIILSGGDRKTLTPAEHVAENNHIHHYGRWARMYQKAVSLNGVGLRAAHNLIHNAPHMAIGFGGNDHVIEFNEIHSVCYESNDAGAMYSGRDWTQRGTVIRHNYLHDITGFEGRGCVGVYLDDMFCGTEISGNLFRNVTRAAFIGGGRDNAIVNNVFVDCRPAIHVDARALGWAHYHADMWLEEAKEKGTLSGTEFDEPPYSERYPALAGILEGEPKAPEGNVIARNVCAGGRWDEIETKAVPYLKVENNLIDESPGFVDRAAGDYRLKQESPAFELGFEPIPVEKMGVYASPERATWPVEHEVRPAGERE